MISAIVSFVTWLLGKIFGSSATDVAAKEAERAGSAQQAVADRDAELAAVSRADAARNTVRDDAAAVANDPDNRGG